MLRVLNLCDRGLNGLLSALVLITSAVTTLCLVVLVITRYFFDLSLAGMHETSLFAAIWLYMAGAVMATRRGEHLVVDILATSLPSARGRAWHSLMIAVITLVIVAFFAQWVWGMFAWGMKRPQIIPVLNVPLWWAQAPLALMVFAGMLYGLRDLARALLSLSRLSKEA
ncbi:TRAP transporter small permease [Pseudogemmobacter faecipullorum]|uniref:TRAP transporter small permease protein n=1 Tax=Pseudogemmobacter faecipullorum TaxID=2755041 RepID=A0ABS8CLT0_9RHOB|nr:TRAP transporter small permease [Pseudogemmobacter faecipullorum]MCB5410343.1 TRAP transporter small permease subunit [Pseudogemmobacter faecipullorum]